MQGRAIGAPSTLSRDGRGGKRGSKGTLRPPKEAPLLDEEELLRCIAAAESQESAARALELRLRDELAAAQAGNAQAKRREARAREAADEARQRFERSHNFRKGEVAEVMKQVIQLEKEEKTHLQNEDAWRLELDAMVLEQANAMKRRDILINEKNNLEVKAREDEAYAVKAEARVKHAEERRDRDRARIDAFRHEMEELRRAADAERVEHRAAQQKLDKHKSESAEVPIIWRRVAACLTAAVIAVVCCKISDPKYW